MAVPHYIDHYLPLGIHGGVVDIAFL